MRYINYNMVCLTGPQAWHIANTNALLMYYLIAILV